VNPAGGRILVVDDVEANRDLLARRLEKLGHRVETAIDGAQALALLAGGGFDLMLLDIMMPVMDGFEVLARVRADDTLRHLPVIVISALGELEAVVRCIELGADDHLPKPFNPVILRARVGACLEKKALRDQERLWARSLERELEIGHEIQKDFLPGAIPEVPGWELAARFEPARQVAGDFYDAFPLPGGRLMLVIADVCGKGVGAALYMALFRTLIRAVAAQAPGPPEETLARAAQATSDYIATTHERSSMFATAFLAILEPDTGRLPYLNAGHEAPLVLAGTRPRTRLAPTGPALGLLPGLAFTLAETLLAPGETLVLYTDGITEAIGAAGMFGDDRLLQALAAPAASAGALLDALLGAVREHAAGFQPSDDITLLALRR